MGPCAVVKIKHEPSAVYGEASLEINATDFDPKIHELFVSASEGAATEDKRTAAQLRDELIAKKIAFDPKANKAALLALLAPAPAAGFA